MSVVYDKDRYERNKEKILKSNRKYKLKIRDWFRNYKKGLSCKECGETHPACLEFHHLRHKDSTVSNMVGSGYSKERILKEIAKCEVLCANCHRKVHYKER